MKIVSIQISNILSFRYVPDIADAEIISFDDNLNIIIGENGSGKSTALEVINFIFRRIINRNYAVNLDLFKQRENLNFDSKRNILQNVTDQAINSFRLNPNWNTDTKPQTIRLIIKLDDIDAANIAILTQYRASLMPWIAPLTGRPDLALNGKGDVYTIDITLQRSSNNFSVTHRDCALDFGYDYLTDYNFYKEAITLYNFDHATSPIPNLFESFTLISSYRNYHAFNAAITLRDQHPAEQMRQIRTGDFNRSLNANDTSEPTIFGLVRLQVAEKHFGLFAKRMDEAECEAAANDLDFIKEINNKLRIVNLQCKIKLTDQRTWQYSFEFFDLRRGKPMTDINSLSAGQKAITHLVFEAYGRGSLKGGVVIIDEPEIHLHYQFQHEYLQVIRELNKNQSCQYILVTHSEALINSSTIGSVRRFSLNDSGHTEVKVPSLSAKQKLLIRILDNTRSTYAFFAKKVLLVEGDSDRYFFKAVIQNLYPKLDQEIAVLHVIGKNELIPWTEIFELFGLKVYRVADLDYAYEICYPTEHRLSLATVPAITAFKAAHLDLETKIIANYAQGTFIFKEGDLERYLGIKKDLSEVIAFCANSLPAFLQDDGNDFSVEVRDILSRITS